MLRRFFFVGVITVILPVGSARQLFAALIVAVTWLLLLTLAKPFKADSDDAVAVGCSFSLVALLTVAQLFQLADLAEVQEDVMSARRYALIKTNEVALSFAMCGFLVFAFLLVCGMIGGQAYKRYLKDKEAAKWAVPTLDPPYFQWRPKRGMYTCFLRRAASHALVRAFACLPPGHIRRTRAHASPRRSHYKMEVGSDARYLSDLLRKMLRCPAFLDSSTLSDLRTLFSNGIAKSDVILILGSPGYLTRPWYVAQWQPWLVLRA